MTVKCAKNVFAVRVSLQFLLGKLHRFPRFQVGSSPLVFRKYLVPIGRDFLLFGHGKSLLKICGHFVFS